MVFGRRADEFWAMTPAQLHHLSSAHRKAHAPPEKRRGMPPAREELGGFNDLMSLSKIAIPTG